MIEFTKCAVLGNDFVIIDASNRDHSLKITQIADRKDGIGCDQLIVIKHSDIADFKIIIYNSNGSMAEACANGTCAVAYLMSIKLQKKDLIIESSAGLLYACTNSDNSCVTLKLPFPSVSWRDIPLKYDCNTLAIPIQILELELYKIYSLIAVNVGNPHLILFCKALKQVDITDLGKKLESHLLFPNKTNVSAVERENNTLKIKVWERGVGETEACGTAACAAFYAAKKMNYITSNCAQIFFKKGSVEVGLNEHSICLTAKVDQIFHGIYLQH